MGSGLPGGSVAKNPPAKETWVWSLGREYPWVPGASMGNPTRGKGHEEEAWQGKGEIRPRGTPLDFLEHLPTNQSLSALLYYAFHPLFWH